MVNIGRSPRGVCAARASEGSLVLTPLPVLLSEAARGGYALGYFEAWDSYSLDAIVDAAEEERSPVILGFGCMMVDGTWLDEGGIAILGCMGHEAASRCTVGAALLLNEARSFDQIRLGLQAGFNAVMLDTSRWDYATAVEAVRQVVEIAHHQGVAVEAELGSLPDATPNGVDDSHARLTQPPQAHAFVRETGVDALAVSVGNVHLLLDGKAAIDLQLLAAIHGVVDVPLVMHGGTGIPPAAVPDAISLGVHKFNLGTILKRSFLAGMQGAMGALSKHADVHRTLGSHRDGDVLLAGGQHLRTTVRQSMNVYGSSGRAATASPDARGLTS